MKRISRLARSLAEGLFREPASQTCKPRPVGGAGSLVKVKGQWKYLYRAVDSFGNTLDFLLRGQRDASSAQRFFRKVLSACHSQMPRVINVDKNAVYPLAVDKLKASKQLPNTSQLRQIKYLNNLVEQEHRFIKRLTKPGMGFGTFHSARRTLRGMEAMNMIRSRTDPQPQKRGHYGTDLFDQSSLRTSCLNFLLFLQYWLFCSLFATQP